ncbi:hypothetical protein NOVOSPHI9U_40468 [Novosphingobium sp. 9U]|nr:hypothetical protein NOVOSPHI9U_40468 [Novosphingobium sp. 9U]
MASALPSDARALRNSSMRRTMAPIPAPSGCSGMGARARPAAPPSSTTSSGRDRSGMETSAEGSPRSWMPSRSSSVSTARLKPARWRRMPRAATGSAGMMSSQSASDSSAAAMAAVATSGSAVAKCPTSSGLAMRIIGSRRIAARSLAAISPLSSSSRANAASSASLCSARCSSCASRSSSCRNCMRAIAGPWMGICSTVARRSSKCIKSLRRSRARPTRARRRPSTRRRSSEIPVGGLSLANPGSAESAEAGALQSGTIALGNNNISSAAGTSSLCCLTTHLVANEARNACP